MSDFEYLRGITVGQYYPAETWIHKRDPRVKLSGFAVLLLAISLADTLNGVAVGILAAVLLIAFSKISLKQILRGLLTPLPFLLLLAALQLFITPHNDASVILVRFFGLGIYPEGLYAAFRLMMRFTALVMLLSAMTATISTLELIHGLDLLFSPLRAIGISPSFITMSAQITFRFIPFLAINAEKIAKAQAARGAEWGNRKGSLIKRVRQFLPLLIPLFNNSLQQAETLADAMLARGFASNVKRSGLVDYRMRLGDWLFLLVLLAISAGILFL